MTNQEAINSLATDMLEKGKEVAALRETINRLYAERDNALDELTLANAECSKQRGVLMAVVEAGRCSDQHRALYMVEIAKQAL